MLDENFQLRQKEAFTANEHPQEAVDPQQALHTLLTMEAGEAPTAVDVNPDNMRKLMEAALQADNSLTPRVVSGDRHNMIYTLLT